MRAGPQARPAIAKKRAPLRRRRQNDPDRTRSANVKTAEPSVKVDQRSTRVAVMVRRAPQDTRTAT
jgi:hypothetical protein